VHGWGTVRKGPIVRMGATGHARVDLDQNPRIVSRQAVLIALSIVYGMNGRIIQHVQNHAKEALNLGNENGKSKQRLEAKIVLEINLILLLAMNSHALNIVNGTNGENGHYVPNHAKEVFKIGIDESKSLHSSEVTNVLETRNNPEHVMMTYPAPWIVYTQNGLHGADAAETTNKIGIDESNILQNMVAKIVIRMMTAHTCLLNIVNALKVLVPALVGEVVVARVVANECQFIIHEKSDFKILLLHM